MARWWLGRPHHTNTQTKQGDPGLGKSQMLRAAAAAAPRSVYVCGNVVTSTGTHFILIYVYMCVRKDG
jgi:hypothetical protein